MKKFMILLALLTIGFGHLTFGQGQLMPMDSVEAPADYENIYVKPLFSDSLVSSFVIFIKKGVKAHRHLYHSEHVYVLAGAGEMTLGFKKLKVTTGDVIYIPKNTIHSVKVTSKEPMKVISIQAPHFKGEDRVMLVE